MDITSLAVSPAAMNATQGSPAEAAQTLMLKKAMDIQASSANALIQALPQPAALATSGSLGRNVNTYA
jgi:Putative motility protein